MTTRKRFSSYRLSEECHGLLGLIAEHLGSTRTAVIEQAVRNLARREGLATPASGEAPARKKSGKGA